MAVIGKIRKHSGLLVVVIGVALAAFVLGDFSKTRGKSHNIIGEINGKKISYKEFNNKLEQNIEFEKQNTQKQALTAEENFAVRQNTWNQMLSTIILGEEFESLGITVGSEELFELIQGKNPHRFVLQNFANPQTGEYDPNIVLNFLKNIDRVEPAAVQSWLQFEQAIKSDRKSAKLINLITKGYYIPEALARLDHQYRNERAGIKIISKKYGAIPDSVIKISDEDLQRYYQEHIDEYRQIEELRSIDYVVFEVKPSLEDRVATTKQVNEIFEEFKTTEDVASFVNSVSDSPYDSSFYKQGELPVQLDQRMFTADIGTFAEPFLDNDVYYMAKLVDKQYRPDSMRATQILISYQGALYAKPELNRSKSQAQNLADSLYQVLRKNPDRMEALAIAFSDDPTALTNGGDMGWFADLKSGLPWNFNNAVYTGNTGTVEMLETPFGYHVIKITGKKQYAYKVRVAIIDRAIEPGGKTFQDIYTKANKFAAENNSLESFENALSELGLSKRTFPGLRKMTNTIPGIKYPRSIVRWAFDEKTEIGSISPILDFEDKFVIAVLTDIEGEGTQPFEKVKELVEAQLIKEKKYAYILNSIKGLTDFNQIAEKLQLTTDSVEVAFYSPNIVMHGREPGVVGSVFATDKGATSQSMMGNNGLYVFKVMDKIYVSADSTAINSNAEQLKSVFLRSVYSNNVYTALENAAEIVDNRHIFY